MRPTILLILAASAALAASASTANGPSREDARDAIEQLDETIEIRNRFTAIRRHRIDSLAAKACGEDAAPYIEVAHAYAGFNNDSALAYLKRAEERAEGPTLQQTRFHLAALLPLAGLFDSAENKIARVDTTLLDRTQMLQYYDHARQMYSYFAAFFQRYPELNRRYSSLATGMQQRMLSMLPPDSDDYIFNAGELAFMNGQYEQAGVLLRGLMGRKNLKDKLRARAAHHLATIAENEGDETARTYYLAESAISDLRSATREMSSLQDLGALLYSQGDIDRAYTYLTLALASAVECGADVRMLESARSLPYIEDAYTERAAASKRRSVFIMIAMAVLLVGLMITMLTLRREMNRMQRMQQKLSQANRVKEVYISQFLTLCSVYMDKLKQFSKLVTRKIGAGQVDELYRMARNGKFVEDESHEFYEVFDNAFLHIYPDFVARVNALLQPDKQIELKDSQGLNTDLRILAFMRLGIEDSSSIARVLNYSLNTIYAYRNRLKARAINRDTFEQDIMLID
ncbi:MAG: hypothetical protein K2M12_06480 [Muribaculaceae bacterium]|nr:hypothetical protein [Muribaculaceae bacterium]